LKSALSSSDFGTENTYTELPSAIRNTAEMVLLEEKRTMVEVTTLL